MTTPLLSSDVLSKTFHILLLITQSAERVETAMLRGIECMNVDLEPQGELLRRSMTAAFRNAEQAAPPSSEEMDEAALLLRTELKPVLRLPSKLRECFTLRFLAGLSAAQSARLLHLAEDEVETYAVMAAKLLSSMPSERKCRPRAALAAV